jgi:hypothetical protein
MSWQPIETAPIETELLLWYPPEREPGRSGPGLDHGGAIQGWWFSSAKEIDDGWETVIGFIGEPTHWMPLPAPPMDV